MLATTVRIIQFLEDVMDDFGNVECVQAALNILVVESFY